MGLLPNLGLFFLYIQTVVSQSFQSVSIQPAPLIEWDQQPYTFYTGQTMNLSWTQQGFGATDTARITYPGVGGTRTLTSGASIQSGFFSTRLADASNMAATNVPVTLALSTNAAISIVPNQTISVIQSKITNIVPLDGNRTLGGGQNAVCDDRNLTVVWRGLGEAQFGAATVSLSKISGSPGTLGTTQTNIPISGNSSITIFCPRTSVPSTFSQYAFQISVVEPGGSPYTGTSASFSVAAAPTPSVSSTPSKTSTPSPSPSKTPTPSTSISNTPTPSTSISNTPTPTSSQTSSQTPSTSPSITPTPSTTETARASIDYALIARNAASQVDTTTPAIAGALGGIGGLILLLGIGKWYQTKQMTERRKQRLGMTSRFVQEASSLYGIRQQNDDPVVVQPSVVMYTVANMPQRASGTDSIKKGFAPKAITK